ncbi:MAG TPA: hypothetical protein PLH98_11495 [Ruminococcus flavefaciens]|nr:hypothetical protein [Ruminococcus flavefaciens]
MWILDQTKKKVVNIKNYDSIANLQGCIRVIRSNGNVHLGVYDQERAAEVFEELLISLANGDNLFRMPEK